jgi:preprotein translocase subunit YajC
MAMLAQALGAHVMLSNQLGGPGEGCAGGGGLNFIFMMIAMFAIFYFLLIRPQQKKAKQHQEMLKSLKRGDSVVTNGGIAGTVTGTTEKYLTVEIAEKVRIRVLRSHVAGKEGDPELEAGRKS